MGSQLIKAIEHWFLDNGMKKSFAEIRISNKASIAMFKKNSYNHFKTVEGYYYNGETAVKYQKKLP